MNIFKSILVLLGLLALVFISIRMVIFCSKQRRKNSLRFTHLFVAFISFCIMMLSLFLCGDYVYPFERNLEPILIAEYDVPEGYELEYPGQESWHGAYEKFGLYPESVYFDPTEHYSSKYDVYWPPMNFERYCYIFTYGQKIETLSYNVWDIIETPKNTGAKVGHMILDEEFTPGKIYIYKIPKIRIENDVYDTESQQD